MLEIIEKVWIDEDDDGNMVFNVILKRPVPVEEIEMSLEFNNNPFPRFPIIGE